jgi:hypothetical protein
MVHPTGMSFYPRDFFDGLILVVLVFFLRKITSKQSSLLWLLSIIIITKGAFAVGASNPQ